jgi:cytochrome c-type biogenesis protein CcmH/NrfF
MKHARARCLLALAVPLLALALIAGTPPARAAEGWAYEMANEMMSPFCPGRSIADCPSPQAQTLRMWLIVQESAGRARADVEAELVSRYGESILGAPRAKGIGLTAYVIPVAAGAAGAALLAWFLRRQTRRPAGASPPAALATGAPLDPELERLVDEKLAER